MKENVVKINEFPKDKVTIYDDKVNLLYIFCCSETVICIRKNGRVVMHDNWKKISLKAKKHLKEFLGGMYLSEIDKEIESGNFIIRDLTLSDASSI